MKKIALVFVSLVSASTAFAADPFPAGYDEAADIAQLQTLENERMHYTLLRSQIRDPQSIWQAFEQELNAFGQASYQRLQPLIVEKSIDELQAAIANGRFSYEQLVTFYIYRLRDIESDSQRFLNSVIALNPQAIEQARNHDRARERGDQQASPLAGMPVLLKDNIGFAGIPTTAGAVALLENVTSHAFVADKLEANGAIILGKANLSEWAYFFCDNCPSGYSAVGGQTLNPYGRLQFGTGGSSAGSGAAIAANLAAAAVGSETSGSILSPSSANSLVGLKPTTGSLSRSGVVPISATLDTTGPMVRSVADAVALFNAMAGYDQNDLAMPLMSEDFRLEVSDVPLTGKRLGVLTSLQDNDFYTSAIETLSAAGAETITFDLESMSFDGFDRLLGGEMVRDLALYFGEYGNADIPVDSIASLQVFNNSDLEVRAPYGQALIDMMAALDLTSEELEALRIQLQDQASGLLDAAFASQQLDVLVSVNNSNAGLAALANYPALTIPMGYQENGRPIGLTFFAPSFREQDLIDIGLQFEKLTQARKVPSGYQ